METGEARAALRAAGSLGVSIVVMRRIALGTVLLSIAVLGQAKEYGHYEIKSIATVSQSATGQHSVTINFSLLDQLLADLSIHNNNYPA